MLTKLSDFTQDAIIRDGIRIEAGYVDNPADKGGATNLGITYKTAMHHHDGLVTRFGWDGDMRTLTPPMAIYIYQKNYWDVMNLDAIVAVAPLLASFMFKAGINCGPRKPQEWLQNTVNVLNKDGVYYKDIAVDGDVGPATMVSMQGLLKNRPHDAMANMLFMMTCMNCQYYFDICETNPGQEVFESGWNNRIRLEYANLVRVLNTAQ